MPEACFDVEGVDLKEVFWGGGVLKKGRDPLLYGLSGVLLEKLGVPT